MSDAQYRCGCVKTHPYFLFVCMRPELTVPFAVIWHHNPMTDAPFLMNFLAVRKRICYYKMM